MLHFDCLILSFATISTCEKKPAAIPEHSGDLETVGKKVKKKKKKRQKEEEEEESRQCSNGPDDETERAEPPSKKCSTDDAISKKAAGTDASIQDFSLKL